MTKTGTFIVIVLILIFLGGMIFFLRGYENNGVNPTPTPTTSASPTPRPISDMIHVTEPQPNAVIDVSKPLTIKGEARGPWYFEAQFPVKLLDDFGNQLSLDIITASGSWMTEDFVSFSKTLNFPKPTTLKGTLVLNNDNASGLLENSLQLNIPVVFNLPTITVKAFFGNEEKNPGAADCSLVYPVTRTVAKTSETARAALTELLKGVTAVEQANSYLTSINKGITIKSLNIKSGTATVDFDQQLQQGVGGSCKVTAIRAQITQTLMQFSTVKKVVISIDGKTEDILQP